MKTSQIAIQFFTLREHTNTLGDFRETCRKVAEIGYQAVQISAVDYAVIPEEAMAGICAENGLTICATHDKPNLILDEPRKVVERLDKLGTRFTAYPALAGVDLASEESVAGLIAGLDAAGKVFAEAGKVLAYHNHHHEFRRLDGRLVLERIYAETGEQNLQGEIDTYWVQFGGGDPVGWCRCLNGRLPLLHLKDYRINEEGKPAFAEIGRGNLDIPGIIRAAEESGCEWFIVEQDTCPGDPFESIAASFDYLKSLAVD
ncbi:MAG: sugar phosphate isomerase/epimerase family protein [Puniceicoccaceae bacterium]